MLHEKRNVQFGAEMSETMELAKKLQALTGENLYLERHLAAMVMSNRALQSMRSGKSNLGFFNRSLSN